MLVFLSNVKKNPEAKLHLREYFVCHYTTPTTEGALREGTLDRGWRLVAVSISHDVSVCFVHWGHIRWEDHRILTDDHRHEGQSQPILKHKPRVCRNNSHATISRILAWSNAISLPNKNLNRLLVAGCGTNHKPLPLCICQRKMDQINSMNSNCNTFQRSFLFLNVKQVVEVIGWVGFAAEMRLLSSEVVIWWVLSTLWSHLFVVFCLLFWLMLWALSYNHLSHHRVTVPKCLLVVLGLVKSWALCLIL